MLRVPISYAKPGMVLAMPIVHPRRPDTILLKAGIELDARTIDRLAEIRLRDVWIRYPGTDFLCEYYCPEVFRAQARLTQQVSNAIDDVMKGSAVKLEYNEYRHAIAGLIDRLLLSPQSAMFMQEIVDRDQPQLRHAAAVSILSILMGLKLDDYMIVERTRMSAHGARDVASLGLGAMLHDIGMLRIPADVVARWNKSQDEDDMDWRAHVQIGHEMVKDAIGPTAGAAVLHHHQKFDGSGFPRRIKLDGNEERVAGSDIHIFARIVAAADLFDRLRYPPSLPEDAAPVPVVRALSQMQKRPYVDWIDPMVFKALLAVTPAYAPGTIVRLSTGLRCVVAEWFPDDPCRPTVQVMTDAPPGAYIDDAEIERIALSRRTDLTIVEAEGQAVGNDNFYPQHPGQYDLSLAGRALFNGAAKPGKSVTARTA